MRIREVKAVISAYLNKPVHNIFWMCNDQDGYDWYYVKENCKIRCIVKFDNYTAQVVEVLK